MRALDFAEFAAMSTETSAQREFRVAIKTADAVTASGEGGNASRSTESVSASLESMSNGVNVNSSRGSLAWPGLCGRSLEKYVEYRPRISQNQGVVSSLSSFAGRWVIVP